MDSQSPCGEPRNQSRTWSMAADAADAADDAPRALMMAAPRCCTVGMKSVSIQAWSTSERAAWPFTRQWLMSGYWVAEWLPQMTIRWMSLTCVPVLAASCESARLWSRRVIAVKLCGLSDGAFFIAISALVLAGLPTTSTRTSREATASSALPCAEKICALASSRSLRSMPGPRGRAPTSSAAWQSLNATRASSVAVTLASVGNAQSSSSITTPCSVGSAGVISSRCRWTGWSGPNRAPEATRKARA